MLELESQLADKEAKLDELLDELAELRDSSLWLTNELESMIQLNERLASNQDDEPAPTLFASSSSKRSQLIEQLRDLRVRSRSRVRASELMLAGRQRRRSLGAAAKTPDQQRRQTPDLSDGYNSSGGQSESPPESEGGSERQFEWTEQVGVEIYTMLRNFLLRLQQRREALQQVAGGQQLAKQHQVLYQSPNSAHDSGISADDSEYSPPVAL